MKKVLALLLAMGMTASLVGCGGSGTENSSSSPRTEETSLSTEMTTVQVTEEVSSSSIEMTADDTGEGEKTLTSVLFDVTIPEGLIYEVYSCAFADETNGSIEIKFGKESTLEGRISVSTQGMVKSFDEAVQRCIDLRNLDTYENGKSEIGEDVTIGDTTYKEVKMSTEWDQETVLATYYKTDAGEDAAVDITLADDKGLTFDDPLVKSLVESIVYKK